MVKIDINTKIVNFLKRNPNPKDSQVHKFAKRNKYDTDTVEEALYKMATKYVKRKKK